MDDNSKKDFRIDVEQLPEQKEPAHAFSVITETYYITKPNLLILAGVIAIAARLLGYGEGIIELAFGVGFLVSVKHFANRIERLEDR